MIKAFSASLNKRITGVWLDNDSCMDVQILEFL